MQRFKQGDPVYILPKYSHLYPSDSAVVVGATVDAFRPMFNEYTLQFPDTSATQLFEFQIIEGMPNYQTLIANLVFDSWQQSPAAQTRGAVSDRQLILQTSGFDVPMKVRTNKSHASIIGQVLERSTNALLKNVETHLMKESIPIMRTITDTLGFFKFDPVSRGSLNILVLLPQYLSRILGAFSISLLSGKSSLS
jgi:hypothetical protein